MRTLLLALLLMFSACKKSEKKAEENPPAGSGSAAAPAAPAGSGSAAPAEPAGSATAEGSGSAAPAAPATVKPVGSLKTYADYEAKASEITDKLLAIFTANATNCDKLAAALTKLATENKALFDDIKGFEKANPDASKALDEKMKPRQEEFEQKLEPIFAKCHDHKGLEKALALLPTGGGEE